jgi:hypothetical protein
MAREEDHMATFTVEFVSHTQSETIKETKRHDRSRRARCFGGHEDANYKVHPSGVLEVITPVKKENGERETDDLGDDVFESDFFAQGEWVRVYDGPPKVGDR